ncbi:MAG: DNA-methyltransferase [Candidatus Roizmanbacteria bacterium GW2011_GWB1_40_7]|uniref:site-specific DNA-methyltransferase (adenine-specific) n=1 Tax=Candidatus Roizmanbacteria bacterium GW2011_GWB1_40_7 TaxID=1618482 RepID=A0A0G0T7Y4_9BACT|nr:MAG: DNA-methyltransferase [Candidatus Roizmanbacteria bacterium GW2011_GWB1_40_7]
MIFYSPLRYPGGKNKLAKFIAMICEHNNINGHYIEPYAGGASVALYLLLEGCVSEITINDKNRTIYAFWYSVVHKPEDLIKLIQTTRVNISTWKKQRAILQNKEREPLLRLGFATFFLNRTNVSGILTGGPIGNINQTGFYKLNCRFDKKVLIERIRRIANHKDRIHVECMDAIDLVKKIQKEAKSSNSIFYFDPPYYLKGESLYMNHYEKGDHIAVGEVIKNIKSVQWIVSYDDHPEIRKIYSNFRQKTHELIYSAHGPRIGKEIIFFSRKLLIPRKIYT